MAEGVFATQTDGVDAADVGVFDVDTFADQAGADEEFYPGVDLLVPDDVVEVGRFSGVVMGTGDYGDFVFG